MTSTSVAVGRLSKPDYIAVRVLCLTEMTSLTGQLDNGSVAADLEKVFFLQKEIFGVTTAHAGWPQRLTVDDGKHGGVVTSSGRKSVLF